MPSDLTDHLKLTLDQTSLALAGLGVGSFIGMVCVPALPDRLGRKPVMVVALIIELVALWVLPQLAAEPMRLLLVLFVATFMNAGVVAITDGPLTSGAVPAHLATGIVVGLGELMGGAAAPAIAGGIAQKFGIPIILDIALYAIVAGLIVVVFGVREAKHKPNLTTQ